MKKVPLNVRTSHDAIVSAAFDIALIHITHADLAAPVRLSTDPTERLSVEPLQYGTFSTWLTEDGSPFLFVLMSVLWPDDAAETAAAGNIVLEAVDNRMAKVLRATTKRADVSLAVISSEALDKPIRKFTGMKLMQSGGDAFSIPLDFSREPRASEPHPSGRMTRSRFPGQYR